MPVTMTWNLVSEQAPAHQESIIWLRVASSFGSYGFEPREVEVEYIWQGIDDQGYPTGEDIIYEDGDEPISGCRLMVLFDGWEPNPTDLWMSQVDYRNFIEENIPALKGETE